MTHYHDHPVVALLHHINPLSDHTAMDLAEIISQRSVKKGTQLVRIGRKVENFHFIVKGLARVYYMREGEDVTDYFATEGQFVGAVPALFTGAPSRKAVETVEPSIVMQFSYAEFERLCSVHHDLERAGRKLAVYGFLEIQQRLENMRFLSVRERYEELERKHPGISNRLPLRHIASFLGTTNVSISRIRAGKQ